MSDVEYARIAVLLPSMTPQRVGRWRDHRQVLNGILFRVRTGVPWRDVPEPYGPWKTLYKRFARWEQDGTWARIEAVLQTDADAAGDLNWDAHADATITRVHQHAAGARRGLDARDTARREALGKSRGGWTTKIHTIGDGRGRNLTSHLTPGQDADTRQLVQLLDSVTVGRPGADRTTRLWNLNTDQVAAFICATAEDPVTAQEWARYVPGKPFRPPC